MGNAGCKQSETVVASTKKCVAEAWMEELGAAYSPQPTHSVFLNHPHLHKYTTHTSALYQPPLLVQGATHLGLDEEHIGVETALQGREQVIMVQGWPGSGVTSLLHHILTESCRSLIETGMPIYGMMAGVTSLVYIRAEDSKETLEDTVRHVLEAGCPQHQEQAWQHFISSPKEAALVVDSLNHMDHHPQLVQDILTEMSSNKRPVLVGCTPYHHTTTSTTLPPPHHTTSTTLPPHHNTTTSSTLLTHKHIKLVTIDGLHPSSILTYMDKCFKLYEYNDDSLLQTMRVYVRKYKRRVQAFLRDPMTLSMFCVLFLEGWCTVEDLDSITRGDVYTRIEELVVETGEREAELDVHKLQLFHKYAFNCVIKHSQFDDSDMAQEGIDVEKIHPILRGNNSNFAVYSAAKHVFNLDEAMQHDVLLYLACKPELLYFLNVVLGLFDPGTYHDGGIAEERLGVVVNQQLAVLPDFDSPCEDCQKVEDQKLELRQANLAQVLNEVTRSPPSLKLCAACWEKHAVTPDGMAIIAVSHSSIGSIQHGKRNLGRVAVFKATIGEFLPERKDGLGLFLRVNNTTYVNYRQRSDGTLVISARSPHEVTDVHAFKHITYEQPLHTLILNVASWGGIYGDNTNFGWTDGWRHLGTYMKNMEIQFTPGGVLEIPEIWTGNMPGPGEEFYKQLHTLGCGMIRMKEPPAHTWQLIHEKWIIVTDDSYTYLVSEQQPLTEFLELLAKSKRQLRLIEGEVDALLTERKAMLALAAKYSRVVLGCRDENESTGRLYLSGKKKVHRYDEEGLLHILHTVGWQPEWVKVEQQLSTEQEEQQKGEEQKKGEDSLRVFTSHILAMVTTDALSLYTKRRWTTLWLNTNNMGGLNPVELSAASAGEWERSLRYVTKSGVEIKGTLLYIYLGTPPVDLSRYRANDHGYENLKTYKKTSAALLKALPAVISQLMDCGVPMLVIYYGTVRSQDMKKLVQKLHKGWKVKESTGYKGSKLHKGDKEILVGLWMTKILLDNEQEKEQMEQLLAGSGLCVEPTYEVYNPYDDY